MAHCQFIPPFLAERLGDQAATGLAIDEAFRHQREGLSAAPSAAPGGATWTVHTAAHAKQLPGALVRSQGDPASGDAAVDDAAGHTQEALDFYAQVLARQSFDDKASPVTVTVHYATGYDNAFWDGTQLVFGDGDQTSFGPFTTPIDVLAHEFTHAVTQYTSAFSYQGQSGALNESMSDVFGIMVKQRVLGQTVDQADWLVGAGIFAPGVQGRALRSMQAPGTAYDDPRLGKDPQVATMADYVTTTTDNGGVHINSGIPNHAFYLAATALGGFAWDRAGRVWYDALTNGSVDASADFAALAQATVAAATSRYGAGDAVVTAVTDAWTSVGVRAGSGTSAGARAGAGTAGGVVRVHRTGGLAGQTVTGEVDLARHPRAAEVRELLDRIDVDALTHSEPQPDRFCYEFDLGEAQVTVQEQDLTHDLERLATLTLP